MGVAKFVQAQRKQGKRFSIEEAQALRDAWFAQWPEMQDYFKYVSSKSNEGESFTTQRSLRERGGCGFCDGANTGFQSVIADVAKYSALLVSRACYAGSGVLRDARLVNFLHDELLLEVPERGINECATAVEDLMLAGAKVFVPNVPMKCEAKAMRLWSKRAQRLTTPTKELLIWEP
jgi:DNA polymerase I-like protein with 3'-5' exonuclease and polymerase domains